MLRAGSKFRGTQQSDSQKYNVEVDIQTVDISESTICGYLRIEGDLPQFLASLPSLTLARADPGARDPYNMLRRRDNRS